MSTAQAVLDIHRYTMINKIGEGGFGHIYQIKDKNSDNYYAAKVLDFMIDDDAKDSEEALHLFREINLMSLLNHPSILRFIEYHPRNIEDDPFPTIIMELATNGSLRDIIELENSGLSPDGWDDIKKLINIYGIAAGMSYLHSHNIIHRDLKPENILVDVYLHPKISDFGLSKIMDILSKSMNVQSQKGLKGTPAYLAPEILTDENYSKPGDVYAFGLIVYEIITGEKPFKKFKFFQLMKSVINGYRPEIKEDVPNSYKELIEQCWSQKAEDRPSFDEIVSSLKNNEEFITELTDKLEFEDYVDFIDNYKNTFGGADQLLHYSDFINARGLKKSIDQNHSEPHDDESILHQSTIDSNDDIKREEELLPKEIVDDLLKKDKVIKESSFISLIEANRLKKIEENEEKTDETENNEQRKSNNLIFPSLQFNNLTKNYQDLVEKAQTNPEKQFEVGKLLIEGKNGFEVNISLGLQYIEESVKNEYLEAIIYYILILIKGKIVQQNFEKAGSYLSKIESGQDKRFFLLNGLINRKMNMYSRAMEYFNEGMKIGDSECIYQKGKMYFLGEGMKKNKKEAFKYFNMSKEKGNKKGEYFMISFNVLNKIKEFSEFLPQTQLIFISNYIKDLSKNEKIKQRQNDLELNHITFKPQKTEKIFFNKSLKSSNFIKFLSKYRHVSIEIDSSSSSFDQILDLVRKIKNRKIKYLKIGIVLSRTFSSKCFSDDISYHKFHTSVHVISHNRLENCSKLKNLIIPSSITEIGEFALSGYSSLTQITIPSSVTTIKRFSFGSCSSLTQIFISPSVNEIGELAFTDCTSLTQIVIPPSVTSIEYGTFTRCLSLIHISIPSSVTSIKDFAFRECSSLTEITIPSSVTSIGQGVFYKCTKLTKISLPFTISKIKEYVFDQESSPTQVAVPSNVTSIGSYAFTQFKFIKKIILPSSVTSIESGACSGCLSLNEIIIPSSVTSIGDYAFEGCSLLTLISFETPSSLKSIGNFAFLECVALKKMMIPSPVTSIMDRTFCSCSSLAEIIIPPSVISIQYSAFFECSSLRAITIPSSVTEIGASAFEYCSSLIEIIIPPSVISIGNSAFMKCSSLSRITIPSSVISIGNYAFADCSSLKEITIHASVTSIPNAAFFNCSSLVEITITSSVIEIGTAAFQGCSSLKNIIIPSSVTSIGENAFCICSSLTKITIPSLITKIDNHTFDGCSSLKKIVIPSSVISIGDYAFRGCSSLKKINIPSSVTSIGDNAFKECSSLAQITLPSSLKLHNHIGIKVKLV
ncbi:hypothetical protein M9Y10_010519 [Tritrichomonas musculus]|uniref:Protein kinase domain-containing protein n=1 Tax=Tritrichomonas musculus TaxID=1915356 RepID=A0ABR2IMV1_9EUKA